MANLTITLSSEQSSRLHALIPQERFASPEAAMEYLLTRILDDAEVTTYTPEVIDHLQQGMDEAGPRRIR